MTDDSDIIYLTPDNQQFSEKIENIKKREAYPKRDIINKIKDLKKICPDEDEEKIKQALEYCDYDESEAILLITSLKASENQEKYMMMMELKSGYKEQIYIGQFQGRIRCNIKEEAMLISDDKENRRNKEINKINDKVPKFVKRGLRSKNRRPISNLNKIKNIINIFTNGEAVTIESKINKEEMPKSGYLCRGRVKQKAQKKVDLINLGELKISEGWYNDGYIYPLNYKSMTTFRSSVNLNAICVHECEITKGEYWPKPTFKVTAMDRPNDPIMGKSPTNCWTQILQRINKEIENRRNYNKNISRAPKTTIPGPEYFGLIDPKIVANIEKLDTEKQCQRYWWRGKADRMEVIEALQHLEKEVKINNSSSSSTNLKRQLNQNKETRRLKKKSKVTRNVEENQVENEVDYSSKWSTISRRERYELRCAKKGIEIEKGYDSDNPLPDYIDPITFQKVVNPAISPYGHVMSLATWRIILSENNCCPFTKQQLSCDKIIRLSKNNIHRYKDKIIL